MRFHVPEPPDLVGLRKFGIVTGLGFSILFGLFFPWLLDLALPTWPFIIGGVFVTAGLLIPTGLKSVYRGWMGVAIIVGWLNSQLLLTLVFLLVLTPIGMLRRVFGSDTLGRHFSSNAVSYRKPSENRKADHVERPF